MSAVFLMGGGNSNVGVSDLGDANASPDKVLSGEKFFSTYNNGLSALTGTMTDNGAVSQTISAGGSYTIPKGYHNGSGIVSAKTLASQTNGTAIASNILKSKTAVVNGETITGTMINNGAVTTTIDAGGSYTIPEGYHNGSGIVSATSLSDLTEGTATASDILSGKTATVNGSIVTGTIETKSASNTTITTTAKSYDAGYYPSSWTVSAPTQRSASSQTLGYSASVSYSAGYYPSAWKVTAPAAGGVTRGARGIISNWAGTRLGQGEGQAPGILSFNLSISFGFTPTYVCVTFPLVKFEGNYLGAGLEYLTFCNMAQGHELENGNAGRWYLGNVTSTGVTVYAQVLEGWYTTFGAGNVYWVACQEFYEKEYI